MTVVELLMACRGAGLEIDAAGDWIEARRRSPRSQLTSELRRELVVLKPEIMRLLRRVDRIDDLQEICPSCDELFVDLMGFRRCGECERGAPRKHLRLMSTEQCRRLPAGGGLK